MSGTGSGWSNSSSNRRCFVITNGECDVSGNILSLVNMNETLNAYEFYRLFADQTSLIDASKLELPSTISQNMRNAITKAMRGARSKRTKSVVELLNDIKGASSLQNVGVSSPSNDSTIIRQVGSDATNVNPQIVEREADSTKVNVVNDEEKGTAIPLNNDEGESSNRKISSTMVILPIVIVAAILWIIFGGLFSDRASTDEGYFNTETTDSAVADTTYDDASMNYDEEAPAIADSTEDEEAYDDYNVDYEDEDEATPTYSTLADTVTEYDNGANVTVIQNSSSNGRSISIVNGDTVWSDMRK